MATPFYARYVPPAFEQVEVSLVGAQVIIDSTKKSRKRPREETNELEQHYKASKKSKKAKLISKKETTSGNKEQKSSGQIPRQSQGSLRNSPVQLEKQKTLNTQDISTTQKSRLPKVTERKHRRSEKRIKDRDQANDTIESENEEPSPEKVDTNARQFAKHKTILSKFEKSSHIAAQQTRKDRKPLENVGDDEEDQENAPIEHGLVPLPQPPEVPDAPKGTRLSALPDWLANPTTVSTSQTVSFRSLPLSTPIITLLANKGYQDALAIQSAVLPMLLPGPTHHTGDLCISAATGSGKTLAYVLPMVENLRAMPVTRLRGLIVVPTRELVVQARDTLESCCAGTGLQIGVAMGSKALKEEQDAIISKSQKYDPQGYETLRNRRSEDSDIVDWDYEDVETDDENSACLVNFTREYTSKVDILICTPGRLMDHLKRTKGFTLEHIQWLVIDEADRLLDQSFQQWVDTVIPALQFERKQDKREQIFEDLFHVRVRRYVRKVVMSATMTRDISKLMCLKLKMPKMVVLAEEDSKNPSSVQSFNRQAGIDLPSTLTEAALQVRKVEEKPLYLLDVLSSVPFLPAYPHHTRDASDSGSQALD